MTIKCTFFFQFAEVTKAKPYSDFSLWHQALKDTNTENKWMKKSLYSGLGAKRNHCDQAGAEILFYKWFMKKGLLIFSKSWCFSLYFKNETKLWKIIWEKRPDYRREKAQNRSAKSKNESMTTSTFKPEPDPEQNNRIHFHRQTWLQHISY